MPERKLSLDAEKHSGKIRCIIAAQQSRNGRNALSFKVKKFGRPTLRTKRLDTILLGRLASGHSLVSICKRKRMPCYSTVMNWALNDPEFLEKYNAARAIQTERMIDEIVDIADDGTNDYVERMMRGKPVIMLDNEHVQRSKLRVEARLRIAAKLLPKKYGDKPAEVNNNLQIHNHLHITEAQMREVQEARKRFLTAS